MNPTPRFTIPEIFDTHCAPRLAGFGRCLRLTPRGEFEEDAPANSGNAETISDEDEFERFVELVGIVFRAGISSHEKARMEYEAKKAAFETYHEIINLTTEVFGPGVQVRSVYDPEFPNEKYVVFSPEVSGDASVIVKKESEWVDRMSHIGYWWHGFRLSIKRKT